MAENSKIEWTRHTFNPWEGCQKVGPGCDHCYAEARDKRFTGGAHWGPGAPRRRTSTANWRKPLTWDRHAAMAGERHRVFCASLADVFDNAVPTEWRDDLFRLIASTQNLDWMLLTKRPGNIATMLPFGWGHGWHNVWLGCTVVNQAEADRDIPKLLAVPAAVRFLSMEPLLGPVDLEVVWHGESALESECWGDCGWCERGLPPMHNCQKGRQSNAAFEKGRSGLDLVIVGGESGPGARPMHPDWARSLRDQCVAAGVSFFFKQWGEWVTKGNLVGDPPDRDAVKWMRDDGLVADQPISALVPGGLADGEKQIIGGEEVTVYPKRNWILAARVGKARAGRLLDGRTWDQMPGAHHA